MAQVEVRQARIEDIEPLVELVRECIDGMRRRGIDQWDEIYPDRATLEGDVAEAAAFVATLQGTLVGMAVLNERQEPEYGDVPWLYGGRAGVIHRMMVSPAVEGTGVARLLIERLEAQARTLGFDSIRLDAFTHNPRAIEFYQLAGYRNAGPVLFRKGAFICFEKCV